MQKRSIIVLPEMLTKTEDDVNHLTRLEYVNLIVPLFLYLAPSFPKDSQRPHRLIQRWMKSYTRKRIYEIFVVLYNRDAKVRDLPAYVSQMLKDSYTESETYEELDTSDKARYGWKEEE